MIEAQHALVAMYAVLAAAVDLDLAVVALNLVFWVGGRHIAARTTNLCALYHRHLAF
jgi:hypothetical protein